MPVHHLPHPPLVGCMQHPQLCLRSHDSTQGNRSHSSSPGVLPCVLLAPGGQHHHANATPMTSSHPSPTAPLTGVTWSSLAGVPHLQILHRAQAVEPGTSIWRRPLLPPQLMQRGGNGSLPAGLGPDRHQTSGTVDQRHFLAVHQSTILPPACPPPHPAPPPPPSYSSSLTHCHHQVTICHSSPHHSCRHHHFMFCWVVAHI